MYIRKIAAAAGFACGAALAFAPVSSADAASSIWPGIDGILAGLPAADTTPTLNLAISFDGISLLQSGDASATTVAGHGFALASGDHASAYAAGGYGDSASAIGTYALADAGSKTAGATGFNFDSATDIGTNVAPTSYGGAPDGAYAGGGSLIGATDSSTASSNDTAQWIGNGGLSTGTPPAGTSDGGNSGAFAGDGHLIGVNGGGNGDTAYTSGNLNGFGDGSASVDGNNNGAFATGSETGTNEGAFAGVGNNNSATADTNYTTNGDGVSATGGSGNYAYVDGPTNSTASAGGTTTVLGESATNVGNNNVSIVSDPFGTTADSANSGSSATTSGNSDLAEVLLTHGTANATGADNIYQIVTPLGTFPEAASAAADPAATTTPVSISTTVTSEVNSLNSMFATDVAFAGKTADLIQPSATANPLFDTIPLADAPNTGTPTFLDYELYGVSPIAQATSDPGAYDLANGAEIRFDDAYNVALYALLNNGALDTNYADYFNGTHIADALAGGTATYAFDYFYDFAIGDLSSYLGVNLTFLDIALPAITG